MWLADRSGLGRPDVEMLLAGARDLTVDELAAIATALAVSPARLVPDLPSD